MGAGWWHQWWQGCEYCPSSPTVSDHSCDVCNPVAIDCNRCHVSSLQISCSTCIEYQVMLSNKDEILVLVNVSRYLKCEKCYLQIQWGICTMRYALCTIKFGCKFCVHHIVANAVWCKTCHNLIVANEVWIVSLRQLPPSY